MILKTFTLFQDISISNKCIYSYIHQGFLNKCITVSTKNSTKNHVTLKSGVKTAEKFALLNFFIVQYLFYLFIFLYIIYLHCFCLFLFNFAVTL